jgi:hypothetical protein
MLPLWSTVLMAGAPVLGWWRWKLVLRARAAQGLCQNCGYSRTGLSSATPCPECGGTGEGPGVETAPEPRGV